MGNTITRTVKVESALGNPPLKLEIEEDPGNFVVETFDVKPGDDEAYIPYDKVDNSYNINRSKYVWVVLRGQRVERIDLDKIRDCKILKLVVTGDVVTFEPVKGNFFGRIGIAWKLKSIIWPRHQTESVPMNRLNNIAIE